ncbi:hypothetical protein [Laspinema olomoucense]|uniref:hypothetical protein n=1 Tax=Laspinema olomoucense TaxID=3231600 RepID=UPI0021BA6ACF|nr:hypothetical protein [Laspinema sp. D3d]MCT7970633.1 hypothetical protein [Laspinema sp. D3d]
MISSRFLRLISNSSRQGQIFWLIGTLAVAAIYAIFALKIALSHPYIIPDDARQHVFWMQRFLDADLFPDDVMADYFESVAPAGYTTLYQIGAKLGINPFLLNKILPLILVIVATFYCFKVVMQLFPVPFAAFICGLLLNQNFWLQDDIPSATPVAFAYPLFLAFLYYLLRENIILTGVTIALLGLFYPQCVFLASGLLLFHCLSWNQGRISLSPHRKNYLLSGIGLAVALAVMLPYALKSSEYGPVLTADQAKTLWPSFFIDNPLEYWLCWRRTGIFPSEWCELSFSLPQIWLGVLLPVLLRFAPRFPLAEKISPRLILLPQLLLVSLAMFLAAHALLFQLHLPSRYTEHSLRLVMPIAGAISLTLILEWLVQKLRTTQAKTYRFIWGLTATVLLTILLIYPILLRKFPDVDYKIGKFSPLYEFLSTQPKDTLIASIAEETDNLPAFTNRSILVSPSYVIGYHQTYYQELNQRAIEILSAQYSEKLDAVQQAIQKYGIDLWIVERSAFTPEYLEKSPWLRRFQLTETQPLFKAAKQAEAALRRGTVPALVKAIAPCTEFEAGDFVVLQAECLTKRPR